MSSIFDSLDKCIKNYNNNFQYSARNFKSNTTNNNSGYNVGYNNTNTVYYNGSTSYTDGYNNITSFSSSVGSCQYAQHSNPTIWHR